MRGNTVLATCYSDPLNQMFAAVVNGHWSVSSIDLATYILMGATDKRAIGILVRSCLVC